MGDFQSVLAELPRDLIVALGVDVQRDPLSTQTNSPILAEAPRELSPVRDAIESMDIKRLRSMLERGARLGASDIMSAVRSGDLEVLEVVQKECAASTNYAEYRNMMRVTARQIRGNVRSG